MREKIDSAHRMICVRERESSDHGPCKSFLEDVLFITTYHIATQGEESQKTAIYLIQLEQFQQQVRLSKKNIVLLTVSRWKVIVNLADTLQKSYAY